MVMAAKNDSLQDCVEALKVPVKEEPEEEPDSKQASNGSLFDEGEIEVVPTEKKQKHVNEPKKPRPQRLIWKELTDKLGSLYDFISKED